MYIPIKFSTFFIWTFSSTSGKQVAKFEKSKFQQCSSWITNNMHSGDDSSTTGLYTGKRKNEVSKRWNLEYYKSNYFDSYFSKRFLKYVQYECMAYPAIYYSIYDFYTLQIPVGKDQSTSDTDNVTVIEHTIDTVCCTLIFKT